MAKQRLLDVWILDGNTVYKGVPFNVVADWLQQGRLLTEDRVRLADGKKWLPLIEVAAFAPYLPRPEPLAAEDAAEALEPVELDVDWPKRLDEEDDDVDMIPLIDISLVLLIFFMMTASVSSGLISPIQTPPAKIRTAEIAKNEFWIGVDNKSVGGRIEPGPDGKPLPWYSFGDDKKNLLDPTTNLDDLRRQVKATLDAQEGPVRLRIRGYLGLPYKTLRDVQRELKDLERSLNASRPAGKGPLAFVLNAEVSEPKQR